MNRENSCPLCKYSSICKESICEYADPEYCSDYSTFRHLTKLCPGDIVNTVLGEKARIITPLISCNEAYAYAVRMLNWTDEQVEAMGGEKEAWIIIGIDQIILE